MRFTKEEIASILKSLRVDADLTQKQAAEALGRKQQTLASWETGQSQPDTNTLFELCDLYGASVDATFGFEQHENQTINDIVRMCKKMNNAGQERVREYAEDLVNGGRYKKG